MKQENCRLCLYPLSEPILKFPDTPLANEFLKTKETQDKFPLQVCCCDNCGHYQLNETVDPERLFRHYLFVAGTSKVNVEHFRKYANTVYNMDIHSNKKLKALDIASNDGIFLQHLKDLGVDVLGIDPAKNIADEATKNGIPTIPEFFTEEYSYKILDEYGKFDIITANNVFAHVPDMIGFIKGVRNLLSLTGIFSFEVSYFGDVCDKTLFDTIYHEHTSYHTLTPLVKFLSNHGLEIGSVERIDTHGGSIRVHALRDDVGHSSFVNNYSLNIMLAEEKYIQLRASKLAHDIQQLGVDLNNQINTIKQNGQSIAIYGTPAKATTLMYALNIDESMIDFAIEDAPLKQGTFTPGKHIPVFSFSALLEKKPDVVLILAWNFADSIIEKCKANGYKGKFIVPLPELRVI
jgi:SAM-dependent methyltransferase